METRYPNRQFYHCDHLNVGKFNVYGPHETIATKHRRRPVRRALRIQLTVRLAVWVDNLRQLLVDHTVHTCANALTDDVSSTLSTQPLHPLGSSYKTGGTASA